MTTLADQVTALAQAVGADFKRVAAALDKLLPPLVATLDPNNKYPSVVLDATELQATFPGTQSVAMGALGLTAGKAYFEVTFVSGTSSGNASVGVGPKNELLTAQVGFNGQPGDAGVFQSSGNVYVSSSKVGAAQGFGTSGNVVCVAVDATNRLIWFRVGSGSWNGSGTANPAIGGGGFGIGQTAALYPAICTDESAVFTANFGASAFSQTPPAGFSSWKSFEQAQGW